jgi:mannobiose 2-epimerase
MKNMLPMLLLLTNLFSYGQIQKDTERLRIAEEMEKSMRTELLDKWYPQSMDTLYGGFLNSFTFDFKPTGEQDKMIVTQARHIWSNAKASLWYPDVPYFKTGAHHGFLFLKNVMWDKRYGGFYTLVNREGQPKIDETAPKNVYGNAFGIYALAAYYEASGDTAALNLAKKAFMWLEEHSHDKIYKGYYMHLQTDGIPIRRSSAVSSLSDLGYKDQNSSIHLLEAFTELYSVWKDDLLRKRLQEMLLLIRDVITTKKRIPYFIFSTRLDAGIIQGFFSNNHLTTSQPGSCFFWTRCGNCLSHARSFGSTRLEKRYQNSFCSETHGRSRIEQRMG